MSLRERYRDDPDLPRFYDDGLLIPGWAGELTADEIGYIKFRLRQSVGLRMRWGFKRSAKRFSESHIRAVAIDGLCAIRKPVLASLSEKEKPSKC